jgi:hypothetical protein
MVVLVPCTTAPHAWPLLQVLATGLADHAGLELFVQIVVLTYCTNQHLLPAVCCMAAASMRRTPG